MTRTPLDTYYVSWFNRCMTNIYGWCGNVAHGAVDHAQTDQCMGFVSDAQHTAQLLKEARAHDRHVTYSKERAYIERYRPY